MVIHQKKGVLLWLSVLKSTRVEIEGKCWKDQSDLDIGKGWVSWGSLEGYINIRKTNRIPRKEDIIIFESCKKDYVWMEWWLFGHKKWWIVKLLKGYRNRSILVICQWVECEKCELI